MQHGEVQLGETIFSRDEFGDDLCFYNCGETTIFLSSARFIKFHFRTNLIRIFIMTAIISCGYPFLLFF